MSVPLRDYVEQRINALDHHIELALKERDRAIEVALVAVHASNEATERTLDSIRADISRVERAVSHLEGRAIGIAAIAAIAGGTVAGVATHVIGG